jgi:peptide/nickel transport system ATP-binding protein
VKTLGAKEKLYSIKVTVPSMEGIGPGCRFFARCDYAGEGCENEQTLRAVSGGHLCRCHKAGAL